MVDEALANSHNLMELEIKLRQMGYLCRFDKNRKYWTIRQRDWGRPIRLIRMGEEYSNVRLMARLKEQKKDPKMQYLPEKKPQQYDLPVRKDKLKRLGGLKGLYLHYCYLLGYLPRYQNQQNPKRIHYLYRDDLLRLKNISDEANLLCENDIGTKAQLLNLKEHFEREIQRAAEKRNCYRNEIRRVGKTEEESQRGKDAITSLTAEMRVLRRQVHLCENILSRSAQMEKKVKEAEREEKRERSDER